MTKTKNPKDLTRAIARASKFLRDAGIEVKHTQMLSAIAAYHGFSNREEFLGSVKKPAAPAVATATGGLQVDVAVLRELTLAAREAAESRRDDGDEQCAEEYERAAEAAEQAWQRHPVTTELTPVAGLMPQLQLVERITEVLDRLADGEDFNDVCEVTGISAIVSRQGVLLKGGTLAGETHKQETFLERLQRMSPAEITHADFQLVLGALKRAFKDIEEKLGYTPAWMYPFVNIASSLTSDAEREILGRSFPYQVVSYASVHDFRQGYGDRLVLVGDLAEGIREMRKRLDENDGIFGCAVVSRTGDHRYTTLVRGLDGNYRHDPDGLESQISGDAWDELAMELKKANTFPGCGQFFGAGLVQQAVDSLEANICRGRGAGPAQNALEWLGLTVDGNPSCDELYGQIKATLAQMFDHFGEDQVDAGAPQGDVATTEAFEMTLCGAKFKVVDGVICGQHSDGSFSLRYPGHKCSTREEFEESVNYIFQFQW